MSREFGSLTLTVPTNFCAALVSMFISLAIVFRSLMAVPNLKDRSTLAMTFSLVFQYSRHRCIEMTMLDFIISFFTSPGCTTPCGYI